jgi:WD40 repeat protein
LCIQTFYGHENAVLSASFSQQGDTIASADSDGVVKLWDVRMVTERLGIAVPGRGGPVNDVKFDRSGKTVLAACDDSTIKVFDAFGTPETAYLGDITGFERPVQVT